MYLSVNKYIYKSVDTLQNVCDHHSYREHQIFGEDISSTDELLRLECFVFQISPTPCFGLCLSSNLLFPFWILDHRLDTWLASILCLAGFDCIWFKTYMQSFSASRYKFPLYCSIM